VVTLTTTLIGTLLVFKFFGTIMENVFILVRNTLLTFVFVGESSVWCLTLKHIMHGYLKGTITSLTSCAITLATSSTTLVCTVCYITSWVYSQLGYQKGMTRIWRTIKDKFGFLFILHYYSCNELLYANW
jgi:hypothetical protein